MGESINLYYDQVESGAVRGVTNQSKKIFYNINLIAKDRVTEYTEMLGKENKATIYLATGRYLSIVSASLDEHDISMATFDLFDNLQFAESKAPREAPHYDIFMANFWAIHEKYQSDYNKFALVEGDPPEQIE